MLNEHYYQQEMIRDNHSLLCVLGVDHPELDRVCRITIDHGLRSKLTGAGGGGCAFTYLPHGEHKPWCLIYNNLNLSQL